MLYSILPKRKTALLGTFVKTQLVDFQYFRFLRICEKIPQTII